MNLRQSLVLGGNLLLALLAKPEKTLAQSSSVNAGLYFSQATKPVPESRLSGGYFAGVLFNMNKLQEKQQRVWAEADLYAAYRLTGKNAPLNVSVSAIIGAIANMKKANLYTASSFIITGNFKGNFAPLKKGVLMVGVPFDKNFKPVCPSIALGVAIPLKTGALIGNVQRTPH